MHRKLITAVLMGAALSFRMADDAPAAMPETPASIDPTAAAPATVAVDVPAEHATLVQRVVALLEKDATWLKDNIEAGLTHFEALFSDNTETAQAALDDTKTDE